MTQKAVYFGFHAIAENPGQQFAEFIDYDDAARSRRRRRRT